MYHYYNFYEPRDLAANDKNASDVNKLMVEILKICIDLICF